jgi:hypothetical protein
MLSRKGLIPGKCFVAPIVEHVNMVLTTIKIKYNRQEHAEVCQRTEVMFGQGRKERTSLPVAGVLEACAEYPTASGTGARPV